MSSNRLAVNRFTGKASCWTGAAPLVVILAGVAPAQTPPLVMVPDAVVCTSCAITITPGIRIDVDAADAQNLPPKVVRQDGKGRYWVLSGYQPPMIFDPNGRFIRNAGKSGRGPGEFETPQDVLAIPGDSVLVIEVGVAQVLDGNLRVRRRIVMGRPLYPGVILTWPSAIVMAGDVSGPHLGRRRTHLVSLSGVEAVVEQQLAVDDNVPRNPNPSAGLHRVAPSKSGVWSADPVSYRIRLWSKEEGTVRILERRPDWFSLPSEFWVGNATTPPPPTIAAIQEDVEGRLWVFLRVAAPTWRDAWANTNPRAREVRSTSLNMLQLFKTVIEVIDPAEGRVIARTESRDFIVDVLPTGQAVFYAEDASGSPKLYVAGLAIGRR